MSSTGQLANASLWQSYKVDALCGPFHFLAGKTDQFAAM